MTSRSTCLVALRSMSSITASHHSPLHTTSPMYVFVCVWSHSHVSLPVERLETEESTSHGAGCGRAGPLSLSTKCTGKKNHQPAREREMDLRSTAVVRTVGTSYPTILLRPAYPCNIDRAIHYVVACASVAPNAT